jgi:hypothetical protein
VILHLMVVMVPEEVVEIMVEVEVPLQGH